MKRRAEGGVRATGERGRRERARRGRGVNNGKQ